MSRTAKSRASKAKPPYMRSRAGPPLPPLMLPGSNQGPPLPGQVPTVTPPQTASLDQAINTQASLDPGTDVFPTNPAPLCSVTDALGSHLQCTSEYKASYL